MNYIGPREQLHWSPPQSEEAPFYWLAHLLTFLHRRWPTIAIAVVFAASTGLGIALTSSPRYTAGVSLLFDVRRADLLRQQTGSQDALTLNSVLESQVELLQSAGLARKTVERLGLTTDKHFVEGRQGPLEFVFGLFSYLRASFGGAATHGGSDARLDLTAQQLQHMLNIRRVGQTYVLAISVTSPSPAEAAWLANGVAETYLADELQAKEADIQQATNWLYARLQDLHDQAVTTDRAVQAFKAANHIIDTEHGLMSNQQLTELSSQLTAVRAKTAVIKARLQRIETIIGNGVDGGTVTEVLDDKVNISLREKYVEDERRLAELTAKFGPTHQVVLGLAAEMAEIKKSILKELNRIADTYRSDYEVAMADEVSAQDRLSQAVASVEQTNADLVQLRSLQSSADAYRSLYQNFLQRYTQAVQDQSFPVPEARIITAALPPLRKSEPKTAIIVVLFSVVGAVIGFTIAFMREVLDRGIRTASGVREMTGFNCLAVMPRLQQRRLPFFPIARWRTGAGGAASPGAIHEQLAEAPDGDVAEALRALHIRVINQRLRSGETKVIGCISNATGAGGSMIAVSLARLLAQTSGRTLLMDWDFTQASVSTMFAMSHSPGYSDVLTDKLDVGRASRHDAKTGIDLMPAGMNCSPFLVTQHLDRMQGTLRDLRARYNFIVVDLPSLSTVADSHIAATMLDGIIVVMEWGKADQEPLMEKLGRIGLNETNVIGVVLNKADTSRWQDRTAGPARTQPAMAKTSLPTVACRSFASARPRAQEAG